MIKGFYFDDDSGAKALLRPLREAGLQVETTHSANLLGATDIVHVRYAASLGLCVVTSNQGDFYRLHGEFIGNTDGHAGIAIITQQRWSAGERLRRLLRLARAYTPEEMRNRIEFLSDWGDDRDPAR